ncbi:MAG: hypothetical protein U9R08_01400 [Nanoarchaeota archaeon]|nr:hypothetical protein [Nanoarchaeota archaeon]
MARKKARKSAAKRPARRKASVRVSKPANKFKQNHAWGLLGLLFSLVSLVLVYYKGVQSGLILAILAIVFCENQKNIWHSNINAWGTVLGILAVVLHLVFVGL